MFVIVGYRSTQVITTTAIAILAKDNIYIKVAGTVSLATNALATALIAYKAWYVDIAARRLPPAIHSRSGSHSHDQLGNTGNWSETIFLQLEPSPGFLTRSHCS